MQFNVAQLLREPVGSTREYSVAESVDLFENRQAYPVTGDVTLVRTHRSVLARGRFNTEVDLTCSRCLGTYKTPVAVEFEEEFFPLLDVVSGTHLPPPEEPGQFIIDEHHVIDLTEAVRQYVLMTLPMKPLCKADCAGLCPVCGKNLNTGSCDCPAESSDPRWSKLKDLN